MDSNTPSAYDRAIQMLAIAESNSWHTAICDINSPIYQARAARQHFVLKALVQDGQDPYSILNPLGVNTICLTTGITLTAEGTSFIRLREFLDKNDLLN